ncbi:hypothetical protein GobsT_55830 [Gemmata obscuriglobus]|uniref:Glycosyltransferase RgtA/B/C/D-like domain-containing protein n=1 Tax=Gemmata obscuriglobus TaxID=114 RepID=A0A2Z3H6K3_9BACT|nr:hypothetical protein [Gemmata obscuriglobus]AWM36600.1 hypothetical protein C1280_05875 [Gemmata obscuriglobus]QEG30771.1 hypothetical protein GobsT_55830 [Gemmata obscuriglobus]VTS10102.1 Uncharacterized protein OS=Chroococcidiopsis thermalis PCC 7203 GN=Chro_2615 PE=4 SV=1 [Gemmata obscuriglobus UQM 2246]
MSRADHWAAPWLLGACALAFAAFSAWPFASGWNDGSRLASVESLIERGTFCIDDSVFLHPPAGHFDRGTPPYDPDNALLRRGTSDKLLIDGRYYSDKPPLVSVPLAVAYRGLMALGLPHPGDRPDVFAWVICVLLSGTGYALAVGCLWVLGTRVGLSPGWRLAWLAAFAFGTVLPAYTRSANNHIAQLGAAAAVCVLLCRIADRTAEGRRAWLALLGAGLIAGFAYNLDFGVGPPLVLAVLAAVAVRTRRALPVVVCGLGVVPCVVAGHAINFAIGGDWLKPLNMHPEYLAWPGNPFGTNMTGVVHKHFFAQFLYLFDLLFGKKGFLTHNPPLLLAVIGGARVFLRRGAAIPDRAELLALCGWCAAGWLAYGVLSKNLGGGCVSIRWFVPFLVPGFWALAVVLKARPEYRPDFAALALWGAGLAVSAWLVGPWWVRLVPGYWAVFGGSLLTWAVVRWRAARTAHPDESATAGAASARLWAAVRGRSRA